MTAAYLIAGIILGAFLFWLYQGWWPSSRSYPSYYSDQYNYDQTGPYQRWGGAPMEPAYGYAGVRQRQPAPCGMPCGY